MWRKLCCTVWCFLLHVVYYLCYYMIHITVIATSWAMPEHMAQPVRCTTFIRYRLTRLVLWLLLYTHGISSCARPRLCTWAMSSFLWFMHLVCWKPCVITAHKEFKLVRCIQPGWVIGLYISLQDRVHHAALQACTGCVQRSVNPGWVFFWGGGGRPSSKTRSVNLAVLVNGSEPD